MAAFATVLVLKMATFPELIACLAASIRLPAESTIFAGATDWNSTMTCSLAFRAAKNAAGVVAAVSGGIDSRIVGAELHLVGLAEGLPDLDIEVGGETVD